VLDYRIYYLDRAGHIFAAYPFESTDDAKAIEYTEKRSVGRRGELWNRARRVKIFEFKG
jgi:hypothetical protein